MLRQIPYELKTYKRGKDKLAPPELKKVHPLGKSPVLTVETPNRSEPLVLAESAAIAEYLCELAGAASTSFPNTDSSRGDYYGKHLVPNRYPDGENGKIGEETESWIRYRFFMHYAEGSIMPLMLISLLVHGLLHPVCSRVRLTHLLYRH